MPAGERERGGSIGIASEMPVSDSILPCGMVASEMPVSDSIAHNQVEQGWLVRAGGGGAEVERP